MKTTHARIPTALLAVAALAAGTSACWKPREAGLFVTVEGSAPAPIASLAVAVQNVASGEMQTSVFDLMAGESEITLPTDLGLVLRTDGPGARAGTLRGAFDVCVTARDASDAPLSSGCSSVTLEPGETVDVTVTLQPPAGFCGDGAADTGEECDGADLASNDCSTVPGGFNGGTLGCTTGCTFDTGGCTNTCGNGVLDPTDLCDGGDVGAESCATQGFGDGTLGCAPDCSAFDTSGCYYPPTVPVLRAPLNGSYIGTIFVMGTMRPTFSWEAAMSMGGPAITYELQYSTNATFLTGIVTEMVGTTTFQPVSDLPFTALPPVGARYYWRVRACAGAACSSYSPVWYVNVGRSPRDHDGDGLADVLVGAPLADGFGADSGRAYVFLGGTGASLNGGADGTLLGTAADDQFGYSVAWAGDLNGDGFADAVIGAPNDDVPGTDAGRVYVYLGGPAAPLDTTADAVLDGAAANDAFGYAVAAAGDVNGDGYCDIVVGAYLSDAGGVDSGAAYLFLGGPGASFDSTPDAVLSGLAANDRFGASVSGAGDTNGDGFADLVVGAYFSDSPASNAGSAYIFYGAAAIDTAPDATVTGSGTNANFGIAVTGAGDVDGDAFSDVLVGAWQDATGGPDAGAAFLFRGGAAFTAAPAGTYVGSLAGAHFGESVASAGDLNADGYDDVIIGAPEDTSGGCSAGAAFVFFGGPGPIIDTSVDGAVMGTTEDFLGISVAGVGDVNGNGYDEVAVGANGNDSVGIDAGRVYAYFGGPGAFDATPNGTLNGVSPGDFFGTSVAR